MQVSSSLLQYHSVTCLQVRMDAIQRLSLDDVLELIVMSHDQVRRRSDVAAVGLVVSQGPVEEHGQPHSALRDPPRHDREPRPEVVLCSSRSITVRTNGMAMA